MLGIFQNLPKYENKKAFLPQNKHKMLSSVDSLLLQSPITISELNKMSCEALRGSAAPHVQDTGALSCFHVHPEFQRPYKNGILLDFLLEKEKGRAGK